MVKGKHSSLTGTSSYKVQFTEARVPAALLSRESLGIITGSFSSKSLSDLDSSSDHGFRFFTFFALDFADDGVLLTLVPATSYSICHSQGKPVFPYFLVIYDASIQHKFLPLKVLLPEEKKPM